MTSSRIISLFLKMRTSFIVTSLKAFLLAAPLLVACSADSFDFSSLHAYFVFDNSVHQDPTLQSALNPMSPGVFCRIHEGSEGGALFIYFESNQSNKTTKSKENADDLRRTRAIGVYNKTGVIVGYGNLS